MCSAGTPGARKRVVWTEPLPVADLKTVGRLAGATLNDVLLSAVAGALHRYQRDRGAAPVDLVTMVPVNVRPLDQPLPRELGNRFALVFFRFPSGRPAPLARLAETKRRMDWLKASPEAALTFGLITVDRPHHTAASSATSSTSSRTRPSASRPTSPGRGVRTLAGVPMSGVLGWVPGLGHAHGGGVHLHVCRDRPGRLHGRRRASSPTPRPCSGVRGRGRRAGRPRRCGSDVRMRPGWARVRPSATPTVPRSAARQAPRAARRQRR